MSGTSDKVEGKFDQTAGKAKEKLGETIGDDEMKHDGQAQNIKGKFEEIKGKVKDLVD